jgi:hypothetical protein
MALTSYKIARRTQTMTARKATPSINTEATIIFARISDIASG